MNEFEKGLLKYFTKEQLGIIQKTKIGIAGCGGLGSNIANAIVRSGFKDFEIIDEDVIEASNLNRQNYFLGEIGASKVDTTAKKILLINPDAKIKAKKIHLDRSNILEYYKDRDVIFEAFDNAQSKKLFLESFGNTDKILIMGSGMAGIKNETHIKIRKARKNVYIVGDEETYAGKETPPLAPRVIACAALMASVALEQVLKGK
ncbi:MAG: sulfur carrier protein ThiS adenylyltransferase ThiF [Candidatus Saganbacteria bacterium]|nr:sulfur carrier protein ThiS adenylyltransferase ThiF [Candidatus Saganbacteria bacterium]